MKSPNPAPGTVDIQTDGRGGTIYYREPSGHIPFYWEFGGGDTVALIWIDSAESWSATYPWAEGRRSAIVATVAQEVIRQKASNSRAEIDEAGNMIYIR